MRLGFYRRAALLLTVVNAAAAPATAPAHLATPCWRTLQKEWADGRIDGVYPVSCYREAIARLPADLQMYSSAPEDIARALQARLARHRSGVQSAALGARYTSHSSRGSSTFVWPAAVAVAALLAAVVGAAVYLIRRMRRSV